MSSPLTSAEANDAASHQPEMSGRHGAASPTIWVTRTIPGAAATAARLRRMGCVPRMAPLLRVQWTQDLLELQGVGALAFTSRHGVEGFAARSSERRLPVYCVGHGTARAARDAGFDRVNSADGALDDLVRLIADARRTLSGIVLRPGAAQPAGDLIGELRRHGVEARTSVVYATHPAPLRGELLRLWRQPESIFATLVYSARAARRLAHLCSDVAPPPGVVVCISEAAAAPLRAAGLTHLVTASQPTERAMMAGVSGLLTARNAARDAEPARPRG